MSLPISSRSGNTEKTLADAGSRAGSGIASALWHLAIGALMLMPIGMALAHRSSSAFLGFSALSALLATVAEAKLPALRAALRDRLTHPLGLTILAFLAWTLLSAAWSEFPIVSLRSLGEFWLSVAFAFVLALVLPGRIDRLAFWLLVASCAIAAVMMVIELRTGMALRRVLHVRSATFIFNRPMLTLTVLLPVMASFLFAMGRRGIVPAAVLAGIVAFAVTRSESGAASLGLCTAIVIYAAAYLAPRLVARSAAIAFVLVFAAAPFLGTVGDRLIPDALHEKMKNDHSRDRIDIWLSFGDAIRQDPVLGGGFGVSPLMDKTSVAARVATEHRKLLGVGHPHNAAIQIWAELGIVGVVLTLLTILQTLRAIVRQDRLVAAASLALLAAATAVALVGHGAWQGWWAASLGAALVWLLSLRGTRTKREIIR